MAATATATRSPSAASARDSTSMAGFTALLAEGRKVKITIRLVEVNEHFICGLCKGYFRDAHKIKECSHTFCAGCIRFHFWRSKHHNSCPTCKIDLGAKPWTSLVADPAIQGLADKLLPKYEEQELVEKEAMYERLGIKRKATRVDSNRGDQLTKKQQSVRTVANQASNFSSRSNAAPPPVEKIGFVLRPQNCSKVPLFLQLEALPRPTMKTDATCRIHELRKYLAFTLGLSDANEVEILCQGMSVGGEYSLSFVLRTIWQDPETPMVLEYRRAVV